MRFIGKTFKRAIYIYIYDISLASRITDSVAYVAVPTQFARRTLPVFPSSHHPHQLQKLARTVKAFFVYWRLKVKANNVGRFT